VAVLKISSTDAHLAKSAGDVFNSRYANAVRRCFDQATASIYMLTLTVAVDGETSAEVRGSSLDPGLAGCLSKGLKRWRFGGAGQLTVTLRVRPVPQVDLGRPRTDLGRP